MIRIPALAAATVAAVLLSAVGTAQAEPSSIDPQRPVVTRVTQPAADQQPVAVPPQRPYDPQSADARPRKPPRIWLWTGFGG